MAIEIEEIASRLRKAIAYLKGKEMIKFDKDVAIAIDADKNTISQALKGNKDYLTPNLIGRICNAYSVLSYPWIVFGTGDMLKTDEKAIPEALEDGGGFSRGKLIPLFDAAAIGGNNYGMDMTPARQIEMIQIGGFLRESESALRVYGNSMTPNYPPGCIVGTRPWNERFIEPGRVYVVETHENRFLKRLYYNKDKSSYRCLSDNTMIHETGPAKGEYCYPEFEIPLEDVFKMHKVIGVIKRSTI